MEALLNNLINALGWSIFHSLWQGALIYGVLFFAFTVFPKLNARIKHNMAFGALFIVFSAFCITFFTIFKIPSNEPVQAISISLADTDFGLGGSYLFLKAEAYFPLLGSLYLTGITIQLLVLGTGYFKLKQLKKHSTTPIPENWNPVFEQTLSRLNIRKAVQFFISERVNVPLVIGFFKPVVLFPLALANQLDLQQVEAILIHELSHIRRNDYMLNLIKTSIETILFFNPFIWLASRFIDIEREHACDDLVIKYTGTPLTYAHALLKLELLKEKYTPSLSLAASGNSQHLYQRIKRITNMKTSYMNAKQQLFILMLIASTIFSIAWVKPKAAAEQPKKINSLKQVKLISLEAKPLQKQHIVRADTDSVKTKRKYKIVISDDKGGEHVYTSIKELPDSLRSVIIRSQYAGDSISAIFRSKAWKDQMEAVKINSQELRKKFQSEEWKDQMAKIQESAIAMSKKMQSAEWKAQMEKIKENSEVLKKKFESQEWKDQVAKIKENSESLKIKFSAPEWKEQIEEMRKLQNSPEYKELKKKFDDDLKELKKKKGMKEDSSNMIFFN